MRTREVYKRNSNSRGRVKTEYVRHKIESCKIVKDLEGKNGTGMR